MHDKTGLSYFPQGSASVTTSVAPAAMPSRERFYVELKPGETTFVSWKKLQESQRAPGGSSSEAPAGAHPALEARIAPEVVKEKDPLPDPPNRFSSMIERIEKLYQGGNSDDDVSDYLDDDKYDTRDSFIDDSELNDYFSVEDARLKHNGFFVNKGTLEKVPEVSPIMAVQKRRKRKDLTKLDSVIDKDGMRKSNGRSRAKVTTKKTSSPASLLPPIKGGAMHKEEGITNGPVDRKEAEKRNHQSNNKTRDVILSHCSKDSTRENIDGKGAHDAMRERPIFDSSSDIAAKEQSIRPFDINEPLERDSFMMDQKESSAVNEIKMKTVQKSVKDDVAKDLKKSPSLTGKEISPVRAKGTVLERAFLDLEKGVAELCPPSLVALDPEQGKRNRLPPDIKIKLAKVARLAAKQGRITDELISRLMGILGHVIRVKTLKRNLKAMIEMGISAMQEKQGRLQGMKEEVTEMIKSRVNSIQTQESFQSGEIQASGAEKSSGDGQYQWDHATEDKICDLYEQYIEGMDENKGPQLRKLYAELAELWPDGWMDNIGIKRAVHRAKERKKKLTKVNDNLEVKKRRRQTLKTKLESSEANGEITLQFSTPIHNKQLQRSDGTVFEHRGSQSAEHERQSLMEGKYSSNIDKKNKGGSEGKLPVKKVKRDTADKSNDVIPQKSGISGGIVPDTTLVMSNNSSVHEGSLAVPASLRNTDAVSPMCPSTS